MDADRLQLENVGYQIVDNFLSAEECQSLLGRINEVLGGLNAQSVRSSTVIRIGGLLFVLSIKVRVQPFLDRKLSSRKVIREDHIYALTLTQH